jgi:predicted permease
MTGITDSKANGYGFVRGALALIACVFAVALALLPIAAHQSGEAGLRALGAAAGICLISGLAAESLSHYLTRISSPLAGQLSGMLIRMFMPLGVCLVLALAGISGRENLGFVCYLLAFYIAMLVVETWLAVKRVAQPTRSQRQGTM